MAIRDQKAEDATMALSSARGATYLIAIQVVSRGLTFISNQFLLRHLSPRVLGLATQLELYSMSVLYFSRESIRVAVQQQPVSPATRRNGTASQKQDSSESHYRGPAQLTSQAVVNISYLAIAIGCPLVYLLGRAYLHVKSVDTEESHFFQESFIIVGLSAAIELWSEPCFAIIQQRMLFSKRAAVETVSALVKGLLSCGTAMWMSNRNLAPGALPFAIGQLGFSVTLLCGYFLYAFPLATNGGFSLLPRLLHESENSTSMHLSRFVLAPLLSRSANVYFQSITKHFLTQGDSMILAAFASLEEQGKYAMTSNYGGLVARMIFQPLEESSRNALGRLLMPEEGKSSNSEKVSTAKSFLCDVLRAYGIVSVLACTIGPAVVPVTLRLFMGSRWSSPEIQELLSAYCYYIPFLAFNGITEAFVSSAADNSELRKQTAWMGAFSGAFAAAVYFFLGVCHQGALGLVWANMMNMALRIIWSYWFIKRYFRKHGNELNIVETMPSFGTCLTGLLTYFSMMVIRPSMESNIYDIAKVVGTAIVFGVSILYLESGYLKRQIANFR